MPRHHGIAYRHLAKRGDGQHKWTATANIMTKQSWTADKVQSTSSKDGRKPTTHHRTVSTLQNFYTGY